MRPLGLPKLPGIGESPFSVAGNFVKESIDGIKQVAQSIDASLGTIDTELSNVGGPEEETSEGAGMSTTDGVSDDSTYRFQLDLLIDNATDLETIHLPNKGRIAGKPCDCIAKHARILRAHAKETIPIASRQGKDSLLFGDLATVADHLMLIGTKEAVESGQNDQAYLQYAGVMSSYRKQLESLLSQAKTTYSEQCKTCPTSQKVKALIEKRRQSGMDREHFLKEIAALSPTETKQVVAEAIEKIKVETSDGRSS